MSIRLLALLPLVIACAPQEDANVLPFDQAAPPVFNIVATGTTTAGDTLALDLTLPGPATGLTTYWIYSVDGQGPDVGPCFPPLAGDCIDIVDFTTFDNTMSVAGVSSTTFVLPGGAPNVWFQAAVIYNGTAYLSSVLEVAVDAPVGDTCGDPIVVPIGGEIYMGSNAAFSNNYDSEVSDCTGFASEGPDVVYEVFVGAGQDLDAILDVALGASFTDWSIWLSDDCASNACLVGEDGGNPEELSYTNGTGTDQTIYLIVDGYSPTSIGDYELTIDISDSLCGNGVLDAGEECDTLDFGGALCTDGVTPPTCVSDCTIDESSCPIPQGDTCGDPIIVPATGGTYVDTTVGYSNDYDAAASGCTGFASPGNDVVYEVTINDGDTLDASMADDPAGVGADWSLWLSDDCASNSCLVGDDSGDPEVITYTNTSGGTQVLYLVADGFSAFSAGGAYVLDITISTAP